MNMNMKSILMFLLFSGAASQQYCASHLSQNRCISFTVSQGTGCQWMCDYCANTLGTPSYYFTTPVCTYEPGVGCMGNPQSGITYTCCSI